MIMFSVVYDNHLEPLPCLSQLSHSYRHRFNKTKYTRALYTKIRLQDETWLELDIIFLIGLTTFIFFGAWDKKRFSRVLCTYTFDEV